MPNRHIRSSVAIRSDNCTGKGSVKTQAERCMRVAGIMVRRGGQLRVQCSLHQHKLAHQHGLERPYIAATCRSRLRVTRLLWRRGCVLEGHTRRCPWSS
jgi:hypothetical protein